MATHPDSDELFLRLQVLQRRLYDLADNLGSLTDPEIIAVSEEADRLIVELQRLRMSAHGSGQRERSSFPPDIALSAAQPPEEIRKKGPTLIAKHS